VRVHPVGHGADHLQVDVAAPYGLLEAQWVVDRAKEDPRIKGLVAYAPIEYGDQLLHVSEAPPYRMFSATAELTPEVSKLEGMLVHWIYPSCRR